MTEPRSKGFRGVPWITILGHQMGLGYLFGPLVQDGYTYSLLEGIGAATWVLLGMLALRDQNRAQPKRGGRS
jgi:hypothetical protein